MGAPLKYDVKMTEDIHFLCTPGQYRIYKGWGVKKDDILREYISMRAMGKDETERRLMELNKKRGDIEEEIEQLQSNLENFMGPAQAKADAIVQKFFESGIDGRPPDMQRSWVLGQAGQDVEIATLTLRTVRERSGDDWGGE